LAETFERKYVNLHQQISVDSIPWTQIYGSKETDNYLEMKKAFCDEEMT